MPQELSVGKIGSPSGVKGFAKLHSYSGEIRHIKKLKTATLKKGNRVEHVQFDVVETFSLMW
jgi:ribosomal 30S subunit maturation factor RimM